MIHKTLLYPLFACFTLFLYRFIQIPAPDNDFDVAFYPEGGSLMLGVPCKVAFKAINSNGQATNVSGTIYNQAGIEIETFVSDHLGMGSYLAN